MTSHLHPRPTPARNRRPRVTTRTALLQAAALGGDAARADLEGNPAAAAHAFSAWRQLRRRSDRQSRQMLRVGFDTGYGQAMTGTAVDAVTSG